MASPDQSTTHTWLSTLLKLSAGASPFPWQLALLQRLRRGEVVSTLDIPTGLGKTSVMALWLVARAYGAELPRRLVYVVDRRAVVDQATDVADHLKRCVDEDSALKRALGIERSLPVSTLRGQHVDNREWLEDPSCPAIVVGTVDMVGSRLLFEGYGLSRKMRPYHAGLLGVDTLVVLDEAHLVPPFEKLVTRIASTPGAFGPRDPALRAQLPAFKVMSLSATGRQASGEVFGLTDADREPGTTTRKRLDAKKRLRLAVLEEKASLAAALAQNAWELSGEGKRPVRCLVFSNERKVAQETQTELVKLAKNAKADVQTELFVGGRRVYERQDAAERLGELGFVAGSTDRLNTPAFLFATSAAEVGVDLDADHMVCDLVPWERMVQRLGRVNRRGEGDAEVVVLRAVGKDEASETRLDAVTSLLSTLPELTSGSFDASPGAIVDLKQRSSEDESLRNQVAAASTPPPLYPPLTRPLVEAWSMTALDVHTGRTEIEPWLRGWETEEEPQTRVVWRDVLPVTQDLHLLEDSDIETYLAAAPPELIESLDTETYHVVSWLKKRLADVRSRKGAEAPFHDAQVVAIVVTKDEKVAAIRLDESDDDKRNTLEDRLKGATLIVDARLGGLNKGLLDPDATDATDVSTLADDARVPFRISRRGGTFEPGASDHRLRREAAIATHRSSTGDEDEWIYIDTFVSEFPETEDGRSVSPRRAQALDEHQNWAELAATRIAERLSLPERQGLVLKLAARLHDEGKRAKRWQRAFGVPPGAVLAKSTSRPNQNVLAGYRHEFGSLPYAEKHELFSQLNAEEQDLCLHLIAAHHGRARPTISTEGADEPPTKLVQRSREVALRFARLENRWGPWGLAWWESLLRAADQQASRRNDEEDPANG